MGVTTKHVAALVSMSCPAYPIWNPLPYFDGSPSPFFGRTWMRNCHVCEDPKSGVTLCLCQVASLFSCSLGFELLVREGPCRLEVVPEHKSSMKEQAASSNSAWRKPSHPTFHPQSRTCTFFFAEPLLFSCGCWGMCIRSGLYTSVSNCLVFL